MEGVGDGLYKGFQEADAECDAPVAREEEGDADGDGKMHHAVGSGFQNFTSHAFALHCQTQAGGILQQRYNENDSQLKRRRENIVQTGGRSVCETGKRRSGDYDRLPKGGGPALSAA